MQIVTLDTCAEQAWKNGGGTTRELLAWPDAAHWSVRFSVARIAADGPFSAYPGISRWFAVLRGAGVELTWQDRTAQLSPSTAPLHFDGADAPGCRLLGGSTEDLNLMLRQDRACGGLLPVLAGSAWQGAAGWRGMYTAQACTLQAGGTWDLPADCLAWDSNAAAGPWTLHTTGALQAWWIHVELLPP